MIVTKNIGLRSLLRLTGRHLIWLTFAMSAAASLYYFGYIHFKIPWVPVSVIGTAVAFYVGFKNNQSYDRMWEARKIWGGIVNESRSWGMLVDGFITDFFTDSKLGQQAISTIKKKLVFRQLGWLYAHRSQLLVSTPWEHASQRGPIGRTAIKYQRQFGVGLIDDNVTRESLTRYLPPDEYERLIQSHNTATQIINEQSRELRALRERGVIDDFRHMRMEAVLQIFYTLQGQNERIKKFPLPRQYANLSRFFVGIFVVLIPFSILPEMLELGTWGYWLSIPISVLIGWVYITMEVVGDYSENPFSGMPQDIPMLSLCRTVEIDLLQILGETELPEEIKPVKGILM